MRVKVSDPDGDVYDATVIRRVDDYYVANLNGLELHIPVAEVNRQRRTRQLGWLCIALALLLGALLLAS